MTTTLDNKTVILGELWVSFKGDEEFKDFIEYNDLGLPLAYAYAEGIVEKLSDKGIRFIEETFDLLLEGLGLEDTGYETLNEILDIGE